MFVDRCSAISRNADGAAARSARRAQTAGDAGRKVSIDHRPRSNRRRHRYTAPPCGNGGGTLPASRSRKRAGGRLRAVRSDETRNSDPPPAHHSSLRIAKRGHPSRRDAALKPVGLQGQPMEAREEPIQLRGEPRRWQGEPPRLQEQPTGLRTAATGPRPKETGLGRGAWAVPSRWQEQPTELWTAATGRRPRETGLGRGAAAPWIGEKSAH
jgi:hypothetical protein